MNRETYLETAVEHMRPWFADQGSTLPPVRVSVGWPSRSAMAKNRRRIGECWAPECSADQTHQVFISPCLGEPAGALAVLVHELVHAAVGLKCGHKGAFRVLATGLGLVGKMTATTAGPELTERLNALVETLGPYPHARLDGMARAKQTTRLHKVACPDCGYTIRVTEKWIDRGLPVCPCGSDMELS